jgi:predicted metalloenzyme YecM
MNEIIGDYHEAVAKINGGLVKAGIDRHELSMLDHLCYRTETLEEYHEVLDRFSELGRNLGNVIVEGRPIAAIALTQPLETGGWKIPFLEIAAPKEGSPYLSGLEHAEFVPYKLLEDFEQDHKELNFIYNAMDRVENPELKLRDFGISVKFHRLSLGSVVMIEDKLANS